MKKFLLDDKEIKYEITRKNVKNINIRVKPDSVVYISANSSVSERYIQELLLKNKEFILKALRKFESQHQNSDSLSEIRYLGQKYPVEIKNLPGETVLFMNGRFTVKTPAQLPEGEKHIRSLIEEWKLCRCREYFSRIYLDVYQSFSVHGYHLPMSQISIKNMKTRWGSCNVKNANLSINSKLIEYPEGCIYAVFYHELMHMVHHNHSEDFYRDLTAICPEYRRWDYILKDK
ncbi:MAG: SprT family zinc-dependent metalloprotease [Oscillospiraceae bacterium]|nr:SprT family zinc-dependent metalloprotease [Oscillospiraceae bacterium]